MKTEKEKRTLVAFLGILLIIGSINGAFTVGLTPMIVVCIIAFIIGFGLVYLALNY